MVTVTKDDSGNPFIDIDNVRITMVDKTNKPATKDWAGTIRYLRVQAYKGKGKALHMGAEFPLSDIKKILEFIDSVSDAGKSY